jgi:hypothetical protein
MQVFFFEKLIIQHWGVESIIALLYIIKVTLYPTLMENYEMKLIYKKHDKKYLNVFFILGTKNSQVEFSIV